jgi:hypothetical protein
MTVWICVDTRKQAGDKGQPKVFVSDEAAHVSGLDMFF